MKKIILVTTIFLFFMTLNLKAQELDEYVGTIGIWNRGALYSRGFTVINIMVDVDQRSGLAKENMTDLVIITSCGEINFDSVFDGSLAARYAEGFLFSQLDCDNIIIIRAQAKIGGVAVDLTQNLELTPAEILPMEIIR
jgi:hypothetical protein